MKTSYEILGCLCFSFLISSGHRYSFLSFFIILMAQPSAQEQYLLELINRFRLSPTAEYDLLINSDDDDVNSALSFFGVNLSVLEGQFNTLVSAQPLAWSNQLALSADTHNQLMIENDQQSHNFVGEPGLLARINNAGNNTFTSTAENIFAYSRSPFYAHAGFVIDWGDSDNDSTNGFGTGIQNPAGHRLSLINNTYREIGLSIIEENDPSTAVGPQVVTQHLANRDTGSNEWLLGVAFRDMDDNDFYSIGEGLGGLTVNISGNGFNTSVQTGESGGYQTLVPGQGVYSVAFLQGNTLLNSYNVEVGTQSIKQDLLIEVGVTPDPDKGKIVGIQFDDVNEDGIHNSGEVGIAGRTIFLDENGNRQLDNGEATTTTDANGIYIFNNLTPGNYNVIPVIPTGRVQTSPTPGQPIGSETYQLDDGEQDGWLGFTGDTLIFNQFEAIAGQETLTSISVGLSSRGNPTKLFIYEDMDGDNRPDSNEKRLEITPTLNGLEEELVSVEISPTTVSGTFFVGASYAAASPYTWIPRDIDSPEGKSWYALSSDSDDFTAFTYSSADWLLRANSTGTLPRIVNVDPGKTTGGVNFGDHTAPTAANNIGEVGQISNLTHIEKTITLQKTYINPVVMVQPASSQEIDPVAVRLSNISGNQFTVALQEPSNLDGIHTTESLTYMVLEAGTWSLANGSKLEVGTFRQRDLIFQGSSETISFNHDFSETPVVLSQIQTSNGRDFVRTRQHSATDKSVQIGMEEQENLRSSGHAEETIGYIAIETAENSTWNGIDYEAGRTGNTVTHNWQTLNFETTLNQPQLLASLSTYNGLDATGIRYQNLSTGSVQLRVEEDTTLDEETTHAAENIDFLAFGGTGLLTGEAVDINKQMAVVGKIESLNQNVQTVNFGDIDGDGDTDIEFINPVVISTPASFNGADVAVPRIFNVTESSFSIKLQETDFLPVNVGGNNPGEHTNETVSYLVVEAGTWRLSDGSIITADTIESNRVAENSFQKVNFDIEFSDNPAIISQIQTNNDPSFVAVRQRETSTNGFHVAMQEEEINRGSGHANETIGYIAFDPVTSSGRGNWDGHDFLVGRTDKTFDHLIDAENTLNFGDLFSETPNLFAQIDTFSGGDPTTLRYQNLGSSSVELIAHEDKTFDIEVGHVAESISYLTIEGSGIFSAEAIAL
ncbi:MAG: SdrD B-like domain-containing protein [Phormidesmis sp.]